MNKIENPIVILNDNNCISIFEIDSNRLKSIENVDILKHKPL